MTYVCRKCGWLFTIGVTHHRVPPWCNECGVDFRDENVPVPADVRPADATPLRAEAPQAPAPGEVTSVPVTDTRPWLRAGRQPAAPPPGPTTPPPAPYLPQPLVAPTNPEQDEFCGYVKTAGVFALIAALMAAGYTYTWVQGGTVVSCTVAASKDYINLLTGSSGSTLVARYTVAGKGYEIPLFGAAYGEEVQIVYRTDNPKDAEVYTPYALYKWALLLGLIGFGLVGYANAKTSLVERQREQTYGAVS